MGQHRRPLMLGLGVLQRINGVLILEVGGYPHSIVNSHSPIWVLLPPLPPTSTHPSSKRMLSLQDWGVRA